MYTHATTTFFSPSRKSALMTTVMSVCLMNLPCTAQAQDVILPETAAAKTAEPSALWKLSAGGDTALNYNDNIYKAKSSKTSDMFATIAPNVTLASDLDRHALSATASLEAGHYFKEQDNDYVDGGVESNGRIDLGEITALHLNGLYEKDHIAIGSFEDDPNDRTTEPTTFKRGEIGAAFTVRPTDYLYEIGVKAISYDFDNVTRINSTLNINDDRDRMEYHPWIRTGLYTNKDTLVYIKADMMQYRYDEQIDSTAVFERDSDGKALGLGIELGSETGLRWLNINVGYLARNFDNNFYDDISTVGAEAHGHWQLSPTWKLIANANRSIEETTLTNTSAYIQSRVHGILSYKLTENWELKGDARYTQNDFQNNGIAGASNRKDDTYEAGIGAGYAITPDYQANIGYSHAKRSSNQSAVEYDANIALISISAKLN